MKICVLSNSHAAALRQGLDQLGGDAREQLEVTFFASRSDGLKALTSDGRSLRCPDPEVLRDIRYTSGGLSEIELDQYDVFVVHALGFLYPYAALAAPYSRQFVTAWMQARLQQVLAGRLMDMLRASSRAVLVASPQPYLSEGDEQARGLLDQALLPPVTMEQAFAVDVWRPEHGAVFLPQPVESIVDRALTHRRYSRGSVRLDVGDRQSGMAHPATDHQHMNAEYGRLVWRDLLALLNRTR